MRKSKATTDHLFQNPRECQEVVNTAIIDHVNENNFIISDI